MKEKNPRGLLVFWSTYYLLVFYFFSWNWEHEKYNMLCEILVQDSFIKRNFKILWFEPQTSLCLSQDVKYFKLGKKPLRKIDMHLIHLCADEEILIFELLSRQQDLPIQ